MFLDAVALRRRFGSAQAAQPSRIDSCEIGDAVAQHAQRVAAHAAFYCTSCKAAAEGADARRGLSGTQRDSRRRYDDADY